MRVIRRVSGILWLWSWYTMCLEIFRWRHVTLRLRSNPPPPSPGTAVSPRPGLPLRMLFGCFFVAPVVYLATLIAGRRPVGR
jgi:hypothetical protein